MEQDICVMILAGGKGERLYPLTRDRTKPAVPFGGIYRIIDFTLSNCINSGLRRINILTQYRSISLDRHIRLCWNLANYELGEFINLIPPQQRIDEHWYRGTADAIYQNIYTLQQQYSPYTLILSGDHIYKMDYGKMKEFHREKGADVTIAALEMEREKASNFGVMKVDSENRVIGFEEKPLNPEPLPENPNFSLISMGVYIFNTEKIVREVINDAKEDNEHDFGKNVIPKMVKKEERVFAFHFIDENKKERKYWRDIGAIDAYYEANMDLISPDPLFNLYDKGWPIHTYQEQEPPAKTVFAEKGGRYSLVLNSLISGGCIISGGKVENSILSSSVKIHSFAEVSDSILFAGVEVGRDAKVRRAIIDKRVSIPSGYKIGYNLEESRRNFTVTNSGIVVIPKEMKL